VPKVSVIIPVYNTENFLRKCLDSVCNQTLQDIEIICINDCSTDGSLEILREYAKKDNRIKLIELFENCGAAKARNIGIDIAEGEYLGFVDSDDFIDLDFYKKLYGKAKETDADAVKGKLYLYDINTNKVYLEAWIDINDSVKKNKANFYFTFTTAIYKSSLIKEYNIRFLEGLIHFEDPYFTIKSALYYKILHVVDDACYFYTNNLNSVSRYKVTLQHAKSVYEGAKKVLELINTANIGVEHYKIVYNFIVKQVLEWCNKKNCNDTINTMGVIAFIYLLDNCYYKKDCFTYHFLQKKNDAKCVLIKTLRNKMKGECIGTN